MTPSSDADPRPTALTRPFWDGCARGALTLQRCEDCGRYVHFPRARCPRCGSLRLAWREVDRHGTLLTFTEVHRTFAPGWEHEAPYVVGVAELDVQPGLRLVANLVGGGPPPELGARLVVGFASRPGFGAVPALRLLERSTPDL